jgi:hypothetical protein
MEAALSSVEKDPSLASVKTRYTDGRTVETGYLMLLKGLLEPESLRSLLLSPGKLRTNPAIQCHFDLSVCARFQHRFRNPISLCWILIKIVYRSSQLPTPGPGADGESVFVELSVR